jgi:hypothetical protein
MITHNYKENQFEIFQVHKMHGAIRLNELILEHSSNSQLVLFSLPKPPLNKVEVDDYIHYLEVSS